MRAAFVDRSDVERSRPRAASLAPIIPSPPYTHPISGGTDSIRIAPAEEGEKAVVLLVEDETASGGR
jgi:hypothetical protein